MSIPIQGEPVVSVGFPIRSKPHPPSVIWFRGHWLRGTDPPVIYYRWSSLYLTTLVDLSDSPIFNPPKCTSTVLSPDSFRDILLLLRMGRGWESTPRGFYAPTFGPESYSSISFWGQFFRSDLKLKYLIPTNLSRHRLVVTRQVHIHFVGVCVHSNSLNKRRRHGVTGVVTLLWYYHGWNILMTPLISSITYVSRFLLWGNFITNCSLCMSDFKKKKKVNRE